MTKENKFYTQLAVFAAILFLIGLGIYVRKSRMTIIIDDKDLAAKVSEIVGFDLPSIYPDENLPRYNLDSIMKGEAEWLRISNDRFKFVYNNNLNEWQVTVHATNPVCINVVNYRSHCQFKPSVKRSKDVVRQVVEHLHADIEWHKANENSVRSYYGLKRNVNQLAADLRRIITSCDMPFGKWYEFSIGECDVGFYPYPNRYPHQQSKHDYELSLSKTDDGWNKLTINSISWSVKYAAQEVFGKIVCIPGEEIELADKIPELEAIFADYSAKAALVREDFENRAPAARKLYAQKMMHQLTKALRK